MPVDPLLFEGVAERGEARVVLQRGRACHGDRLYLRPWCEERLQHGSDPPHVPCDAGLAQRSLDAVGERGRASLEGVVEAGIVPDPTQHGARGGECDG
jgi:hypothetical protein